MKRLGCALMLTSAALVVGVLAYLGYGLLAEWGERWGREDVI